MVKKVTNKQEILTNDKPTFDVLDYGFLALVVAIVLTVIFGGLSVYKKSTMLANLNESTPKLEQKISTAANTKPETIIEVRKQKLTSARKAGEELANAESYFVYGFFKSDQQNQADFQSKFEKAKAVVNRVLVPSNKEFLTNPWLRNPEWTLKLETLVNFTSNDVPVIFTMMHDDKLMGIVTCTYDGSNFRDVVVNYTQEGLSDSVDNGGK